jgi:hypothetical protein
MTPRHRPLNLVLSLCVILASVGAMLLSGGTHASASPATTSLTLQTMDSCKRALDGAGYQLTGDNLSAPLTVTNSGSATQTVSSGTCPLTRGSCRSITVGCLTFTGIPAPGTYRIRSIRTPPANSSNPLGYAPCEGGSACRSEEADVSVLADGTVQATVTDDYPDGSVRVFPSSSSTYAGTAADPVVFHDFGLGSGSCDGDQDADDHLTGSPSTHCAYIPEGAEASACPGGTDQTYPWTCAFSTSTSSSTTTTTTTSTTTSTTTTMSSTTSTTTTLSSTTSTTSAACSGSTTTFTGTVTGSSVSFFVTPNSSHLCATLTWTGSVALSLIIYSDGSGTTVLAENTSGASGESIGPIAVTPGQTYKVKAKPQSTGGSSTFSLTVTS